MQNQLVLIPYTVYYPQLDEAGRRHIFASALMQTAGLGFLSFLVFGLLACLAPLGMHPLGASGTCWALAVAIPLLYLRQLARMISFAHMRMEAALGLDLVVGALQVGGIFLLAQLGFGVSAASAYLASAMACAVAVGCWIWPKRQALATSPLQVLTDLRRSWSFSRWLLATSPIAILRSQLPLWLLTAFHGTAATGLYSACVNITSLGESIHHGSRQFRGNQGGSCKR